MLKLQQLAAIRWSRVSTWAVIVYWAAMTLGTHLPGQSLPATPYSDKSLHLLAYTGFGFLIAWAWAARRPFLWGGPLFAIAAAAGYGGLDEFTQTYIPGRYGDVVDWLYDAAGAVIGVALFLLVYAGTRSVRRAARGQKLGVGGR